MWGRDKIFLAEGWDKRDIFVGEAKCPQCLQVNVIFMNPVMLRKHKKRDIFVYIYLVISIHINRVGYSPFRIPTIKRFIYFVDYNWRLADSFCPPRSVVYIKISWCSSFLFTPTSAGSAWCLAAAIWLLTEYVIYYCTVYGGRDMWPLSNWCKIIGLNIKGSYLEIQNCLKSSFWCSANYIRSLP